MVCEHLRDLEEALIRRGYPVAYRGQTWTRNCREWVYFDCTLVLEDIRRIFSFEACVQDHVHRGTHEGSEQGFVCHEHWDAVVGALPDGSPRREFHGADRTPGS